MREDAQMLAGGEVLACGDAVILVALALQETAKAQRRNGLRQTVVMELAAVFGEGAALITASRTSALGSPEVPPAPGSALWALADPVTAPVAAQLMGRTSRNVRDLCSRGTLASAQRVGGQWLIERSEVLDRVAQAAV